MKQFSPNLREWFSKGLSLVLLLTIISSGWLFFHSAPAGGWSGWHRFNFLALGFAILALIGSWAIEGCRVLLIAAGLGEKISFVKSFYINLAATFAGNITPFNSGGVPTQIYLLYKNGIHPTKASAVVTIRVIMSTLLFTTVAPLLMFFFTTKLPKGILHLVVTIAIPISCLLSVLIIVFMIKPKLAGDLIAFLIKLFHSKTINSKLQSWSEKILNELETFHESIKEFRKGIYFYLVIALTILYWVCFFSIAPLLMYAFGLNAAGEFLKVVLFQFILVFIIAYLPIPGGSGVMELSSYSMLVFVPIQLRAIFILLWRFLSYYMSTFIGGLILLRLINRQVQPSEGLQG